MAGHLHETGVDDYAAGVLRFANGVTASFSFGMQVQCDNTAYLAGTEGWLAIPWPWKPPARDAYYELGGQIPPKQDRTTTDGPPEARRFSFDAPAPLYAVEADAFADAVRQNTPMPVSPADTLGNMRLLDALRQQLGLPW